MKSTKGMLQIRFKFQFYAAIDSQTYYKSNIKVLHLFLG